MQFLFVLSLVAVGARDWSGSFSVGDRQYHTISSKGVIRGVAWLLHPSALGPEWLRDHFDNWVAYGHRRGFLLVYPQGLGNAEDFDFQWNGGDCCGDPQLNNEDDVGYLLSVKRDLVSRYSVGRAPFYMAGFSMGGYMAYRASCELSREFTAFASVVGAVARKRYGAVCVGKSDPCMTSGSAEDYYYYCDWDQNSRGCDQRSFGTANDAGVSTYYECQGPKPHFAVNALADPHRLYAGAILIPRPGVGQSESSDPPVDLDHAFISRRNGCKGSTEAYYNLVNADDWVRCHQYNGCAADFVTCTASAGHHWFGEGHFGDEDNPFGEALDTSHVVMEFFDRAGGGSGSKRKRRRLRADFKKKNIFV